MEPMKLLPYLVNVLDVTDEQEVKVKATREDRIDKLLDILPRRGPTAFDDFVKALQEVQPFLATPLLQESGNNETVFCTVVKSLLPKISPCRALLLLSAFFSLKSDQHCHVTNDCLS